MELTAPDEEFRQRVRGWLEREPGRRVRGAARRGRARPRARAFRAAPAPGTGTWRRAAGPASAGRPSTAAGTPTTRAAGDLPRGVRPQRRSAPGQPHGRGTARPDAARLRHRRAEGAVPAADRRGERAVVPGLLRAGRGIRPRRASRPAPSRRRRVGDHRPEGLDVAGHVARLVLRARAHRAGSKRHSGLSYLLVRCDQPGIEVRPDRAADRHLGVQRGLLRRRPHRRRSRRGRGRARAGGWRWPRWLRARCRRPSASRSVSSASSTRWSRCARRHRRGRRPGAPRTALAGRGSASRSCASTRCACSAGDADPACRRRSVVKLLWARWHRELGELAMDVRGPAGMLAEGPPYDLDDWQRLFLFSRVRHHLRRVRRDPARHHRRARLSACPGSPGASRA